MLDPAGERAAQVELMWWVMFAGAVLILVGIMGAALYSLKRKRRGYAVSERAMLLGGGVIFPVVTLLILMVWTLAGEQLTADAEPGVYRFQAQGHRFWWEFVHPDVGGAPLYTANEAYIPAGEPVVVEVRSADVIHSFWVPRLAGKMDGIPGKTNLMRLSADRPGAYGGMCNEFCGEHHLQMRFVVRALAPEDLEARLAALAAMAPDDALPGAEDFATHCAACHSVDPRQRGGPGPNLASVVERPLLGGEAAYETTADLRRWLLLHSVAGDDAVRLPEPVDVGALDRIVTYLESARP